VTNSISGRCSSRDPGNQFEATMNDDDDFLGDMTMAPDVDAPPAPARIFVGERAINHIELEISERMALELQGIVPPIFVDGDTGELDVMDGRPEPWAQFFDGRIPLPWEAAKVQGEIHALVVEQYRDRIAIARELGPRATQQQYEAACRKEGIEP
jgi:hypothetical protein